MLLYRRVLFALTILAVTGSVSVTLGYGLYLRSDWYRKGLQGDVSALLELPVSIGRVSPLTAHSRAFHEIRAALPKRNTRLFHCLSS